MITDLRDSYSKYLKTKLSLSTIYLNLQQCRVRNNYFRLTIIFRSVKEACVSRAHVLSYILRLRAVLL